MKTLKSFLLAALFLMFATNGLALLPPHFTDGLFDLNPNTHPSRVVLKYFEPIDKGFKVEMGNPVHSVYVVDLKDNRHSAYWEYDLQGNLKEKYELEYNEYGLLSKVSKKDKNQNPLAREQYVYANPKDAKTLKEKRFYNAMDLKSFGSDEYMRDKKGNVSAIRHLDGNGKERYSDHYIYNAEGLVENYIRKDAAGSKQSETESSYDEEGRVISEIVYDAQGKTVAQSAYTYNVKGLPDNIIHTTLERKAERHMIEYTYDERGNWIQQIIYKGYGRVPETILVRIITY